MLFVCGGQTDPSLVRFTSYLTGARVPYRQFGVEPSLAPSFHWDLEHDVLRINRQEVTPTAVLLRYDVFSHLDDGRAETAYRAHCWYTSWEGWLHAHPTVRMLNRKHGGTTNKPAILRMAVEAGFAVPPTIVTNDTQAAQQIAATRWAGRAIAKPVVGGEYTRKLADVLLGTQVRDGIAAAPAIVQRELVPPEVRVYRVGKRYFAFEIESVHLDYRSDERSVVRSRPLVDRAIQKRLQKLTTALGLDFAAADFKHNSSTNQLDFLEVNSGPMFAAFDAACDGELCEAILDHLQPAS